MEDVNNELYFMGIDDSMYFLPKDTSAPIDFDG